jgi:hypothetical protein
MARNESTRGPIWGGPQDNTWYPGGRFCVPADFAPWMFCLKKFGLAKKGGQVGLGLVDDRDHWRGRAEEPAAESMKDVASYCRRLRAHGFQDRVTITRTTYANFEAH